MEKLTAASPETHSADFIADNINQLKTLFPEAFTEGKIDFEVLKQLLGGAVEEREEKYGLNWHGKRRARQLALTPSTGTLRPCPEDSVDWDTTQNLMIEGDNLEVLKLLQKSYAGKVKLIYIDPPYNTGKDFVYPDDFRDNIKNYLELTGQTEGGRKISSNTEASGRFHTDWLNMVYPRLKLARNLLKTDGVMFISCDDNEVQNLRALMDEVFGGENFITTVIWQKVFSPKNTARHFSEDHDYIVVYAKDSEIWMPRLLPRTEEMEARYVNPDNDPRGPWTSGDVSARNYYGAGTYPVTCPSGREIAGPPSGRYWAVSKDNFDDLDRDGRIWWGADGNNMPRLKRFLSEVQSGRVPQTLWTYQEVGHTQEAKKELISLVDFPNSDVVFDTPKPTRLIRRILQLATAPGEAEEEDDSFAEVSDVRGHYAATPAPPRQKQRKGPPDIVLDFFAGTGSTMDAVFRQNEEDGGNRQCILVQLPEFLNGGTDSLRTIADIAKERLRRAVAKIKANRQISQMGADKEKHQTNDLFEIHQGEPASFEDNELSPHPSANGRGELDLGFRVFKLDSSNIRAWDPNPDDLAQSLFDATEHLKDDRTEQDILFELLLKLGLELTVPIETRKIVLSPNSSPDGRRELEVHSIGAGVLLVCLAPQIKDDEVEPLAFGIVEWHRQLAPAGDTQLVFRDSAFADDVAKTNLTAILQQHGLTNVRSL
ncbi:MAG: site-specific DNA-methyltransferase [Methylococcaceae bacterium]|nr:site-specific DNA-methyltransferase [Methylococcaceae bacterium]